MKRATLVVLFFTVLACFSWAEPLGPVEFVKSQWLTEASARYVQTTSNYIGSGDTASLVNNNSYQVTHFDFYSRYAFTSSMSLFAGAHFGLSESKSAGITRANSSLTDLTLGGQMKMELTSLDIIPELSASFPLEKTSLAQDSVMSSEGVQVIQARSYFQVPFQTLKLFSHLGYVYRAERSNLLSWEIGLEFMLSKSFQAGGRLFGIQTIGNDPDTGGSAETQRLATTNRVNGGSYYFYSINPSRVETEGYLKIHLGRNWLVGGLGGLTLTGANSAVDWRAGGFLQFIFNTEPVKRKKTTPRSGIVVDPAADRFQEDVNDGVDQRIFYAPPSQPIVAPRETVELPSEEVDALDQPQKPSLQEQLDDVEMTIQLKSNKKKKKK